MRVLILGSGGREHVFTWMLAKSVSKKDLFVAPGNSGTGEIATNVNIGVTDFEAIGEFCVAENIRYVIPGSEDPLVMGIVDYFDENPGLKHIYVLGPSAKGAQLEGSKKFAKEFMQRHHIPTASYGSFTAGTINEGKAFLESLRPPYVLKADGLAAGKGVLILDDVDEAKTALDRMLIEHQFGEASDCVVIEEFLEGIEFSAFVLTDGTNYLLLPEAKDYKRIGEMDQGLNTGGMGAVSPVPFVTDEIRQKVIDRIIEPTVKGLASENLNYKGFIFFGLMLVNDNPYVIEYNVRMGDPETEVVFPRIGSDFMELIELASNKRLNNAGIEIDKAYCTTVFLVSSGYPGSYRKGMELIINQSADSLLFHAGLRKADGRLLTTGGRVLAISSFGSTLPKALSKCYETLEHITFDSGYYRRDIGQDLIKYISDSAESN